VEQLLHSPTRLHDLHEDRLTVGNDVPSTRLSGWTCMHLVWVNVTLIVAGF